MTWIRGIYNFFYEIFFGCSHGRLTRPFTLQRHSYKVCLDCGRQFPYSLEKMRVLHAWEIGKLQPQTQSAELVPALSPVTSVLTSMPASFADSKEYSEHQAVA